MSQAPAIKKNYRLYRHTTDEVLAECEANSDHEALTVMERDAASISLLQVMQNGSWVWVK